MKIVPRRAKLFRGGMCKSGVAFYALNPKVARMYGSVCTYEARRPLKLFTLTHTSIKSVFKYLSPNTKLLMKFIFGTDIMRKNQTITIAQLFGKKPSRASKYSLGERLSVTEIDTIALRSFAREYLTKRGYDGAYMPMKKSKFHGSKFHEEIFVSKFGLLKQVGGGRESQGLSSPMSKRSRSSRSFGTNLPMSEIFAKYTKGTRRLINPYRSKFVMFLSGGMAVKLYLRARGIRTAKTSDFDFKFAVPRALKTQRQIDQLGNLMKRVMYNHVAGFVRFLNRNGIKAQMEVRELKGVPLDKPGGLSSSKKVYKVYNFTIITPSRKYELVDTSLVLVPGITRSKYISLKWSRRFGMPIQTLMHLWKDTLYILAGSFVIDKIKLRNPIDGDKKEKGIKNAIRTGHLSFLTARKRGTKGLVNASRKLVKNVIRRNKASGTRHARQILKMLKTSDH